MSHLTNPPKQSPPASLFHLQAGASIIAVDPAQGVAIQSWSCAGREILVPHGRLFPFAGIPLLFPNAGALEGNRLALTDTIIPKHGFAWTSSWEVREQSAERALLELPPSPATAEMFPFKHRVQLAVHALPEGLRLELVVFNDGAVPMPIAPGWHPYFPCPRELRKEVRIDPVYTVFEFLKGDSFDAGTVAPGEPIFAAIPGLPKLRLTFSPEFRHLQFWSWPHGDFLCIEPFVGPPNAMNTDARLDVPPGGHVNLSFEIAIAE